MATSPLYNRFKAERGSANIWFAVLMLTGLLGLVVGYAMYQGLPLSTDTWYTVQNKVKIQASRWLQSIPGSEKIFKRPMFQVGRGESLERLQGQYVSARTLGLKALNRQGSGEGHEASVMTAIDQLTALREKMPGLEDVLLYRIAELYQEVPNEWQAQRHLTRLIESFPNSPLIPIARYRLAQSYFRGKQDTSARQLFHQLRTGHSDTPYSMGALYYLGELALRAEQSPDEWWLAYLQQSPEGRFASYIAKYLDQHLTTWDVPSHGVVGEALARAQENDLAIQHLKQVDPSTHWLSLATAQMAEHPQKALDVLTAHLPQTTSLDDAADGIELAFRKAPPGLVKPWAKQLLSGKAFKRQDVLYWYLAYIEPLSASQYYQALLTKFPDSVYAPASHLRLLWPSLVQAIPISNSGSGSTALMDKLEHHLSTYGYSRSAATAAFWLAKFYEAQGHPEEAVQRYRQVVRDYPYTYYGHRSAGRLNVMLQDKADPYWTVKPNKTYPTADELAQRDVVFRQEALTHLEEWTYLTETSQLQLLALADVASEVSLSDMMLILTESLHQLDNQDGASKKSALVQSWEAEANENRPKAIRLVRDELADLARDGDMQGFQPNEYQLKQMYPTPYWGDLQPRAIKNGLDPFVAFSLMREESYFNPNAVSSSDALGLMQLLPTTAAEVAGWENRSGFSREDLFHPKINIQLGTRYLGHLFTRFDSYPYGSMLAVGAYNGGPNAMAKWVGDRSVLSQDPDAFVERIPYEQTRDYIKKVYTSYWNYRQLYAP